MDQGRLTQTRSRAGSGRQLSVGVKKRRDKSLVGRTATRSFWVQKGTPVAADRTTTTWVRPWSKRIITVWRITANGVVFKYGCQVGEAAQKRTTQGRWYLETWHQQPRNIKSQAQCFEHLHTSKLEDTPSKKRLIEHFTRTAQRPCPSKSYAQVYLDDSKSVERGVDAKLVLSIRSELWQIRLAFEQIYLKTGGAEV